MKNNRAVTAIVMGLLAACVSAQSTGQATGTIEGVVFTVDANGGHAVIPTARILLRADESSRVVYEFARAFLRKCISPQEPENFDGGIRST